MGKILSIDLAYKNACDLGICVLEQRSHNELQALASGFGGLAIATGKSSGCLAVGTPPKKQDGVIVEGFIVNPRR